MHLGSEVTFVSCSISPALQTVAAWVLSLPRQLSHTHCVPDALGSLLAARCFPSTGFSPGSTARPWHGAPSTGWAPSKRLTHPQPSQQVSISPELICKLNNGEHVQSARVVLGVPLLRGQQQCPDNPLVREHPSGYSPRSHQTPWLYPTSEMPPATDGRGGHHPPGVTHRLPASRWPQDSAGWSWWYRSKLHGDEILSIWEQPAELPAPGSSSCCYIWKLFSPLIALNALTRGVTNKTLIGRPQQREPRGERGWQCPRSRAGALAAALLPACCKYHKSRQTPALFPSRPFPGRWETRLQQRGGQRAADFSSVSWPPAPREQGKRHKVLPTPGTTGTGSDLTLLVAAMQEDK